MRADILGEGRTRHLVWDTADAVAVPSERPISAEIIEERGAVFLLRLNAHGECVADTWHGDLVAAKSQAAFEYGIAEDDWILVG